MDFYGKLSVVVCLFQRKNESSLIISWCNGDPLARKKITHSPNAWVLKSNFVKNRTWKKKFHFEKPAHRKDVKVLPVLPKLIPNWKLCWFCRLICKRKTSSLITLIIYFLQAMQCLQKKAEFRSNSLFAEFLKVPLLTLLKIIYYFVQDDSQRRILRTLNLNASLVSQICRRLQDVCFLDLQTRPVIPFGGPGAVVKCDESKFNHKAKVNVIQK